MPGTQNNNLNQPGQPQLAAGGFNLGVLSGLSGQGQRDLKTNGTSAAAPAKQLNNEEL